MSSITEASAALSAAKLTNKPVWVAFSVSDDSPLQLRSGESLLDAVNAIMPLSPDAILLNCSQPEAISKALCLLSDLKVPIGAYANGFVSVTSLFPGTTVETLETRQDLNPQQYKKYAQEWLDNGAAIIGGCCEIGPKHIDALQSLTRN
jgi:S-methylmethionine-dependent homocysteine/selenocysteine methylase